MSKVSWTSLAIIVFTLCACRHLTPEDFYKNKMREADFFSFSTADSTQVRIDFGESAAGALVQLFASNPLADATEEDSTPNTEPFFKAFLDGNGCFNQMVEIPSHACNTIYVYTTDWRAPACTEATVDNGSVTCTRSSNAPEEMNTKVSGTINLRSLDSSNQLYTYFTWGNYGAINDQNDLVKSGSVSSADIKKIQKTLWNNKSSKPNGLDNSKYLVDAETTNINVRYDGYDEQGEYVVNFNDLQLYFTFLTESGWNQNAIGYYFYDTDNPPTDPSGLKKYLIVPNCSVAGNAPYGVMGRYFVNSWYAPIQTNTEIQLLYFDSEGNASPYFPKNTTVGYFVMLDAYKLNGIYPFYSGSLKTDIDILYSNHTWNGKTSSNFIALNANDGMVVYGVEDSSSDKSYDDVLFCITSNHPEAIYNPYKPKVEEEEEKEQMETESGFKTYAFEDIWPTGGDYDMNDVVVEHKSTITFNENNYITKVVDNFIVMNRYVSARNRDAFGIVIAPAQRGRLTIPAGAVDESVTNAILLFEDAQDHLHQQFTVTREFGSTEMKKGFLKTDLDPFIIISNDERPKYTDDMRYEVHMPKKSGTSKANPKLYGYADEAFYVNKDGKHPFSITIPLPVNTIAGFSRFVIPREMMNVSNEYDKFDEWVESGGKEAGDWYLHYVGREQKLTTGPGQEDDDL